MRCIVFTLTFNSSPIKEEGILFGWFVLLSARPLTIWIADLVRNDMKSCPDVPHPVNTALKPV